MPDANVLYREKRKQELEQRLQDSQRKMAQRSTTIEFQADTLSRYSSTNAYYDPQSGRVVRNVYSNQDSESKIKENISHEAKHAANARLGIPDLSAEQFYKLRVLDEVSAWTVSVLCWREEYLAAENKEKFLEEAGKSSFWNSATVPYDYLEAIRQGKVNPESKDPKEFDKEMELLVGEQFRNMAAQNSGYVKDFEAATRLFMNTSDRKFQQDDAEFERFSQHYMTIGGLDFRKYLTNDWQDRIYVPERIGNAGASLAQDGNADNAQMLAVDGLVYDGTVSLEQYHNLLQHKKIAENVFHNLDDKMKKDLQSGGWMYDEQISQSYDLFSKLGTYRGMSGNNEMESFLDVNMALALNSGDGKVGENQAEYLKKLKEIYTVPGTDIDLTAHIDGFDPNNVPVKECPAIDEFRRNPDQYRQDHPYQPMLSSALEYNQGDAKWQEHSEENRVSDVLKMDVLDSGSDFLKAERENRAINQELERIKKQEEAEKVEPLTVKPQTRIYGMLDGVKFYLNRPTVFQKAELKSYVNEQGEKIEVTMIDGKKHGAAFLRDENGNIKDVKLYDQGKEIDLSQHTINIKDGKYIENGKEVSRTEVTLDGKPFGAVVEKSSAGTKADFYDSKGVRMEGAPNAKMTQTEEYVSGGKPGRGSENAETAEATPAPAENKAEVQTSEVLTQPADSVQIAAPEKTAEPVTAEKTETENCDKQGTETEKTEPVPAPAENKAEVQTSEVLTQPADSVQKVAEDMKRGHDRIAAMRAKVAAGHEAERTAMYAEFLERHDNTEAIRRLRSSKTISSGIVRPTSIRADLLQKQLQEFQIRP